MINYVDVGKEQQERRISKLQNEVADLREELRSTVKRRSWGVASALVSDPLAWVLHCSETHEMYQKRLSEGTASGGGFRSLGTSPRANSRYEEDEDRSWTKAGASTAGSPKQRGSPISSGKPAVLCAFCDCYIRRERHIFADMHRHPNLMNKQVSAEVTTSRSDQNWIGKRTN